MPSEGRIFTFFALNVATSLKIPSAVIPQILVIWCTVAICPLHDLADEKSPRHAVCQGRLILRSASVAVRGNVFTESIARRIQSEARFSA